MARENKRNKGGGEGRGCAAIVHCVGSLLNGFDFLS